MILWMCPLGDSQGSLLQILTRTNYPPLTCSWNSLPDKVVEAPSMQSFDRRLDNHWRDHDLIFNYEAALRFGHRANYELKAPNFCSKSDEDLDTQD